MSKESCGDASAFRDAAKILSYLLGETTPGPWMVEGGNSIVGAEGRSVGTVNDPTDRILVCVLRGAAGQIVEALNAAADGYDNPDAHTSGCTCGPDAAAEEVNKARSLVYKAFLAKDVAERRVAELTSEVTQLAEMVNRDLCHDHICSDLVKANEDMGDELAIARDELDRVIRGIRGVISEGVGVYRVR